MVFNDEEKQGKLIKFEGSRKGQLACWDVLIMEVYKVDEDQLPEIGIHLHAPQINDIVHLPLMSYQGVREGVNF